MQTDPNRINQNGNRKSRSAAANIALFGFLAIGAFYLIAEHRAHLLGWLPWLLITACPLLHIFMHGKHGGHGNHSNHSDSGSSPQTRRPPHQH